MEASLLVSYIEYFDYTKPNIDIANFSLIADGAEFPELVLAISRGPRERSFLFVFMVASC